MRTFEKIELPFQKSYVKFHSIEMKNGERWIVGNCICGNIVKRSLSYIKTRTHKRVISCGCQHPMLLNTGNKAYNWSGYEEIPGSLYQQIRKGAQKRKIHFDVEIEYLWELFIQQDKKCTLTGLELKFWSSNKNKKNITASLDRIDSTKGYIKDNIQWVHKSINMMKQQLSQDEFIHFCKLVSANFS